MKIFHNITMNKLNRLIQTLKFILLIGSIEFGASSSDFITNLKKLKSVMTFNKKWISTTKQHTFIMYPSEKLVDVRKALNLVNNIGKIVRQNNYCFMFTTDFSYSNKTNNNQTELIWFPFNFESYERKCKTFGLTPHSIDGRRRQLLFTKDINNTISFLKHCKIRFDDEIIVYYQKPNSNIIIFKEIYKIDDRHKNIYRNILFEIDLSTNSTDWNISIKYIWKRRKNLQGIAFQTVTEIFPPSIYSVQNWKDSKGKSVVHHAGYFKDILNHLQSKLNFSTNTSIPKKRNNWGYIVKEVEKHRFDIGELGVAFTPSRSKVVDFSFGILTLDYTIVYVPSENSRDFWLFLHPFNTDAWIAVIVYIMTFATFIYSFYVIFEKRSNYLKWKDLGCLLQKSINFILRSVVGKTINFESSWNSAKIAFLFIVLHGYLLITCYRALLVASMTAEVELPPIRSLQDLSRSNYILGVRKGSASETLFKEAEKGSIEYDLNKTGKIQYITSGTHAMLDKMVSDATFASKFLFFSEKLSIQFRKHYPCRLFDIKETQRRSQGSIGMIYRKGWQFKDLHNYHLLVMKENGVMDKLYEPYLRVTKKTCPNKQIIKSVINKPSPVSTNETFFLYLIVLIGTISSIIFLTIEILCQYIDIMLNMNDESLHSNSSFLKHVRYQKL